MAKRSRTPFFILAGLLFILAAGIRLYGLGATPFWIDETRQFNSAKTTVNSIIHDKYVIDEVKWETPDPPLMLFVQKVFMGWGGDNENRKFARAMFRLPSALFGLLSIYLMFLLGAEVISRRAGIIAAIFAGFFYHSIFYAREARPYTLVMALSVALGLVFFRLAQRPGKLHACLMSGLLIAALYTHYFCVFLAIVATSWFVLFFIINRKHLGPAQNKTYGLQAFTALAAAALAYLPWLPALLRAVDQGNRGVPVVPKGQLALPLTNPFSFFISLICHWSAGDAFIIPVVLLMVLGIVTLIWKKKRAALLLLPWLFVPWLIFPWMHGGSLVNFRHLIFGYPAFLLILAGGIDGLFGFMAGGSKEKTRLIISWAVVALVIIALLLPSLLVLPHGLFIKCFGETKEKACLQFIDKSLQEPWWYKKMNMKDTPFPGVPAPQTE